MSVWSPVAGVKVAAGGGFPGISVDMGERNTLTKREAVEVALTLIDAALGVHAKAAAIDALTIADRKASDAPRSDELAAAAIRLHVGEETPDDLRLIYGTADPTVDQVREGYARLVRDGYLMPDPT